MCIFLLQANVYRALIPQVIFFLCLLIHWYKLEASTLSSLLEVFKVLIPPPLNLCKDIEINCSLDELLKISCCRAFYMFPRS